MSVPTAVGVMQLTITPSFARSLPRAFVNPMTAAFDAEYGVREGLPFLPAIEARLTMRPYFCAIMTGITARLHR